MLHPLHALREELVELRKDVVGLFQTFLPTQLMPAIDTLTSTVSALTDAVNALPARIAAEIAANQAPSATEVQLDALNTALVNLTAVVDSIATPTA